MGTDIFLSVVIRCRNEAKALEQVLEALARQQTRFPWEVVVVDNESADETRALCRRHRARVVPISRAEFTYGRALNRGIEAAQGQLIVLLSAHSLPVGRSFLESAAAPFEDPSVAAARCLFVNNVQQLAEWYSPRDIRYRSLEEQRVAEAGGGWLTAYPAATCCVIRRSVWQQVPYDEELEANEDKWWASQVLQRGFKIRCCAEAMFVYLRRRGWYEDLKKRCREWRALYRASGQVPLRWPVFWLRVARAFCLAPAVAGRYLVQTIVEGVLLVTIPWQARSAHRKGSVKEFNQSR